MTLGEKIKSLRASAGLTLEELGLRCESSKGYIFDLEAGKLTKPSAQKLLLIALALGVTVEFLLDDNLISPNQKQLDDAFFNSYKALRPDDKQYIRKIVMSWARES